MASVRRRALIFVILFFALVPGIGAAQWVTGPSDKLDGGVNWTTQVITATGLGVPPPSAVSPAQGHALAVTAATVLARTALLEVVRGVAIDSQTTVQNHIATNSVVQQRVSGIIRGAQVLNIRDLPNGSVEVTVGIPATGEFADLMLPRTPPRPPAPAMPAPPPAMPAPTPAVTAPAPAPRPTPTVVYTGLVIDARGLGVKPAMAPKVLSEGGQEVYGFSVVDRNWVIQQGMAGYSKDLTAAQAHERVTDRPLTLKARAAAGANKTDVVISNVDAELLLASGQHLAFLEKARVMLVVD
jgi:hypothetical protein